MIPDALPGAKNIMELSKYNNKKEIYFYPGEEIKIPEKNQ